MSELIIGAVVFGTAFIALMAWLAVQAVPLSLAAVSCGGAMVAIEKHYGESDGGGGE